MKILLVNDDGIHAPGLHALHRELQQLGDVQVVAPLAEQSGVGLGVTYLHPIMVKEIFENSRQQGAEEEHVSQRFGWAVDGSPADCVKMGVLELCEEEPDLVVSGINAGANVGINVLYSGTVAAAIEGAFFGITSMAVSLSQETPPDYSRAAQHAIPVIQDILRNSSRKGQLWNINLPDSAPSGPKGIKVVRMAVNRRTDKIEKRIDPRGRPYYWSGLEPIKNHELEAETDVNELMDGFITITPLHFDLTEHALIREFRSLSRNNATSAARQPEQAD